MAENKFQSGGAWKGIEYLSANAIKDSLNFLLRRSLSSGSLGSMIGVGSLRNSSPLSGIPRAWPIVSNSLGSLFLKLICESRGSELDIEKKTSTRMPPCRKPENYKQNYRYAGTLEFSMTAGALQMQRTNLLQIIP